MLQGLKSDSAGSCQMLSGIAGLVSHSIITDSLGLVLSRQGSLEVYSPKRHNSLGRDAQNAVSRWSCTPFSKGNPHAQLFCPSTCYFACCVCPKKFPGMFCMPVPLVIVWMLAVFSGACEACQEICSSGSSRKQGQGETQVLATADPRGEGRAEGASSGACRKCNRRSANPLQAHHARTLA